MMYEGDQLKTFNSDAYIDRLNHPTHWTREMAPGFRTSHAVPASCTPPRVMATAAARWLMRFEDGGGEDDLSAATLEALDHFVTTLPGLEGVTAAHLGFCRPEITNVDTAEKQARAGTSRAAIQECAPDRRLRRHPTCRTFPAIEANLSALGMPANDARYGFYGLSHLLTERTSEEPNRH